MNRKTLLKLCAAWIVGTASAAHAQSAALSGDEVRKSVIGRTMASRTHSGRNYTMVLNADGTGLSIFNGSKRENLTWDLTGNVLCFHGSLSGTECNVVKRAPAGFEFWDAKEGALNNSYTLQ